MNRRITHQCSLCGETWHIVDPDHDPPLCPQCGHGLVERRFHITD